MRCPSCKRELPPPATICPHDGAYLLTPLSDTLKRGPLSLSEATRIGEQLCDLLAPLHASGRAHTRMTPDNVFFRHVGSELTVRITDPEEPRPVPPARYATPERARGAGEDARADIYQLGILLHHLIAGAPPFDLGTEAAILKKHAEAEPGTLLALELQDVPEELDVLIKRMLSKQPSARPAITEIREVLENADTGSTITGAKLAALGLVSTNPSKDTDPERLPMLPAPASSLDEPTVESKPIFDLASRDSQNPTLYNVDRKPPAPPVVQEIEHPTSLEIDPYGDTVLRARPGFGEADTRLAIQAPRPTDETEPPAPPKAPEVKKSDPSPRGPTIRTEAPSNREQQVRLALMVLIVSLGLVVAVLAFVLLTRN